MKKIFYLGYYDIPENKKENRNIVLAATNKMSYIISTLDSLDYEVTVVSASATKNRQAYPARRMQLGVKSELLLFKTLPWGNKLRRIMSVLYSYFQVMRYLLTVPGEGDKVIVYHSVAYANIVRLAKKIKKFQLILEVEEIYADVYNSERVRKKEYNLFEKADAYIFPTELLNEKVNVKKKPYTIIYGTYQLEEDRKSRFEDGKIHCVYAGTFDPRKGGAVAAAAAAGVLPSDYHIHVLGFGSEKDTNNLKEQIKKISEKSEAEVTYDGLLSGEEYIQFVQSCQIGFSTQMPGAAFNETSFPSKVLSYLANGLRVVSVRIKALEKSSIGDLLYFYDEQTPEAIAAAVRNIDFSQPYDSRKRIKELDKEFTEKIGEMLNDL